MFCLRVAFLIIYTLSIHARHYTNPVESLYMPMGLDFSHLKMFILRDRFDTNNCITLFTCMSRKF